MWRSWFAESLSSCSSTISRKKWSEKDVFLASAEERRWKSALPPTYLTCTCYVALLLSIWLLWVVCIHISCFLSVPLFCVYMRIYTYIHSVCWSSRSLQEQVCEEPVSQNGSALLQVHGGKVEAKRTCSWHLQKNEDGSQPCRRSIWLAHAMCHFSGMWLLRVVYIYIYVISTHTSVSMRTPMHIHVSVWLYLCVCVH
jgi:hypothetical protein